MSRLLLLAVGWLIFAGCGQSTPVATVADVERSVFSTPDNLAFVTSATKVTACRIKPPTPDAPYAEGVPADKQLASYVEQPWLDVSASESKRLANVLTDPKTYEFDVAKSCIPVYGVRLRFESESGELDINLCYECRILTVVRDGKWVSGGNFDGGSRQLTAITKELFPEDADIQALKDR
jgi:hypothetical protein